MIRPANVEEIPQLADTWLRASRRAHGFSPDEFWETHLDAMASEHLLGAEELLVHEVELLITGVAYRGQLGYATPGYDSTDSVA